MACDTRIALLALALACAFPAGASAVSIDQRTTRLSSGVGGGAAAGASTRPAVSGNGATVVYDSVAADLVAADANGPVRDVFRTDVFTGATVLVSQGLDGLPADGPSFEADVSADGRTVVFSSYASNLAAVDTRGRADVFATVDGGPLVRLSAPPGAEADGDSGSARVSPDGRYVVFTSTASNLVAGDTNGVADVFRVRIADGRIERVSAAGGAQPNGASGLPGISATGRFVTFSSAAANLVRGDTNRIPDVFLADLEPRAIRRVSISDSGRQQNRTTASPVGHVSGVSGDGRFVVFSSRATNLVARDTNRAEDVFLRDRVRRSTRRVSVSFGGRQGNADSLAPAITPDGRYVAFQSLAGNLAAGGGPGADVVVFDRLLRAPVIAGVAPNGAPKGPELAPLLPQAPSLSSHGRKLAFASTAANLAPGDAGSAEDVFVRHMDPPDGRITSSPSLAVLPERPELAVAVDDPRSDRAICGVTRVPLHRCDPRAPRLSRKTPMGYRRVAVHVGGPGMLFDPVPATVVLAIDPLGPGIGVSRSVTRLLRQGRIAGTTRDFAGTVSVDVAVAYTNGRYCVTLTRTRAERSSCKRRHFMRARGTRRWSLRLGGRVPAGFVAGYVIRARDRLGNSTTLMGALEVGRSRRAR